MALSACNTRTDEQGKELVEHGTALFPVACYHDDLARESVPWHWHDELELNLVSEGSCVMAVDGEQVTLHKGEAALINADVMHACRAKGKTCRLHAIVFHPRLIGGSMESVFYQSYVLPVVENRQCRMLLIGKKSAVDRRLTEYIETAWYACKDEPKGYEVTMREALSRLMLEVRERMPSDKRFVSGKAMRNEQRLKQMLEYIREHLRDDLTVERIAQSAAVSTSECMRCFKAGIGVTPMQYVKTLRLMKAAELLQAHAGKVNEIAERCGFHEMSYFARTFKERYGVTPSQYAELKKGV